ncbi:MAG: histone family protein [Candidatus Woesearchaeota archaeon]
MKNERLLPLAVIEKLMKKAGAERVGDDACEALKEELEERAAIITRKALKYALHAGRKTVRASDIKLALKE